MGWAKKPVRPVWPFFIFQRILILIYFLEKENRKTISKIGQKFLEIFFLIKKLQRYLWKILFPMRTLVNFYAILVNYEINVN